MNISSGLARFAFPGVAVYGALKAALEGLTRYFAKEYAERKIRVNSVAPGAIDTEFGGGKGDDTHRAQIASMAALGRLGQADDVGDFVASLLLEDSRFVNAQRIEVGGGWAIYIHPDFLHASSKGRQLTNYTFFGYDTHECLHISKIGPATHQKCIEI